ncbi:MAG: DUF932 domain-containing protein [Gammaproteobacteria bacterium]
MAFWQDALRFLVGDRNRYPKPFKVVEFPAQLKVGNQIKPLEGHRVLVRSDTNDPLAVVGGAYQILQNADLYAMIEEEIALTLGQERLDNAQATYFEAYGGRQTFKEYLFPDISVALSGSPSKVNMRILAFNSFGYASTKLYAGGIDSYCSNGIVLGDFQLGKARHVYRKEKFEKLKAPIQEAFESFQREQRKWQKWQLQTLDHSSAVAFVNSKFSRARANQITSQLEQEYEQHGRTLWALYSALTHVTTHPQHSFALRKKSIPNQQAVILERAYKVGRMTMEEDFEALAIDHAINQPVRPTTHIDNSDISSGAHTDHPEPTSIQQTTEKPSAVDPEASDINRSDNSDISSGAHTEHPEPTSIQQSAEKPSAADPAASDTNLHEAQDAKEESDSPAKEQDSSAKPQLP